MEITVKGKRLQSGKKLRVPYGLVKKVVEIFRQDGEEIETLNILKIMPQITKLMLLNFPEATEREIKRLKMDQLKEVGEQAMKELINSIGPMLNEKGSKKLELSEYNENGEVTVTHTASLIDMSWGMYADGAQLVDMFQEFTKTSDTKVFKVQVILDFLDDVEDFILETFPTLDPNQIDNIDALEVIPVVKDAVFYGNKAVERETRSDTPVKNV